MGTQLTGGQALHHAKHNARETHLAYASMARHGSLSEAAKDRYSALGTLLGECRNHQGSDNEKRSLAAALRHHRSEFFAELKSRVALSKAEGK